MQKQAEEVPQWVRDFIVQREMLEEEHPYCLENVEDKSDDTYLLCPFSNDEVEAIRNGVWKLREEAFLADAKERRKLRKAGHFVPDSGFSRRDDFFEINFRRLLHTPLSRGKMQEVLVKYHGWKNWSEDPWGDFSEFYKWMNNISDDERDVWAINETFGGRVYLTYWILEHLSQFNYSEFSAEDFIEFIGVGAENFLWVKSYTGWDNFHHHYPKEPLPARFMNEKIIKVYLTCPFRGFRWFINSIYLWDFAMKEVRERAKRYPEVEGFLDYHAATDTKIAELCRKLAPKGYQPLDQNQAWQKIEQSLKEGLEITAVKYDDVYPLRSEHDDVLKESYLTAEEGLLEGVKYWQSKACEAVVAGLKGKLGNSLLSVVKHDFIDAARKAHMKHEVTESEIEATRAKGEGDTTPFLDTIPSPEPVLEEGETETLDLKGLGFNKDKLTPRELLLLDELRDAESKGYERYSKRGLSLKQYWGKDYGRKIKMLKRLEAKQNKP